MPCAQYLELQRDFPSTTKQLVKNYLKDLPNAATDDKGKNPAGYVLYQLRRAVKHAQTLHGPDRAALGRCDHIFAAEVDFQFTKKTEIRNVIPFFGVCWFNLSSERAERWSASVSIHSVPQNQSQLNIVTMGDALAETLGEIKRRKSSGA